MREGGKLAGKALIDFDEVREGKHHTDGALRGSVGDWGCFSAHDMQAGNLHYCVVDFGESILADVHTRRIVGKVERKA